MPYSTFVVGVFVLLTGVCSATRMLHRQPIPETNTLENPQNGDCQLVDDLSPGPFKRLEIFHGNRWGSVCGLNFTAQDARVACAQIQNTKDVLVTMSTASPKAGAPVWIWNPKCTGNEAKLALCRGVVPWTQAPSVAKGCLDHSNDVGLICEHYLPIPPCDPSAICRQKALKATRNVNLRNMCDNTWKTYVVCKKGLLVKKAYCPKGQLYNAMRRVCLSASAQAPKPTA